MTWPADWRLHDVAAVAVDKQDRVYAFHRGEHPVVVFDHESKYLRSWGKGFFTNPHSVRVDKDDNLWFVDNGAHQVYKVGQRMQTNQLLVDWFCFWLKDEERSEPIALNRETAASLGEQYVRWRKLRAERH